MNIQDFYTGNAFDAYEYLGTHACESGYVFRVYAPAAFKVSLIGDFSGWNELPMNRIYDGQFFELIVETAAAGDRYKFRIYKNGTDYIDHADPYAFSSELRPGTASVVCDTDYEFTDDKWMESRTDNKDKPLNIYEIHAGSWLRKDKWDGESDPAKGWLTYTELADRLIPYLKENSFNAVELMPLAEYPADESWGYQATGFFSASSRYGKPSGLQYLVNQCHRSGISVILDVVTVHFAVNDYALWNFDGTALYEYPHPDVGYSEWGSCNFMHSRGDVRSFLQSSCAFWLDKYHIDGLRFDAVGNLIYWNGNPVRGENKDAFRFIQVMNHGLKQRFPSAMLIAEDSTPFENTTVPASKGGLGFDYKWDLGWMNDTLKYFSEHPDDRGRDIGKLLFSMEYFFSSDYLLPLSHDEVVHGKGAIVQKMRGGYEDRIKQAKLLFFYMFMHPGKKLNFMGNELAQPFEWNERDGVDWAALKDPVHSEFRKYFSRLNHFYCTTAALWQHDYDPENFKWLYRGENGDAAICFIRESDDQKVLVAMNFSDRNARVKVKKYRSLKNIFKTYDVLDENCKSELNIKPYQGAAYYF